MAEHVRRDFERDQQSRGGERGGGRARRSRVATAMDRIVLPMAMVGQNAAPRADEEAVGRGAGQNAVEDCGVGEKRSHDARSGAGMSRCRGWF